MTSVWLDHTWTWSNCCSCAGTDWDTVRPALGSPPQSSMRRDTAVVLSDLTQGASSWIQSFLEPMRAAGGGRSLATTMRRKTAPDVSASNHGAHVGYPEGFEPLRSECRAFVSLTSCPIIRNPFVSPLLAPSSLLRGLPPVHIVVRDASRLLNAHNIPFINDLQRRVCFTVSLK